MKEAFYYLMAFDTTTASMQGELHAKEVFEVAMMPVPREVTSGCGLAVRFRSGTEDEIIEFCKQIPVNGSLYKMQTTRVDGRHSIEKLLSF